MTHTAGQDGRKRPWPRALAWLAGLAPFFYLSYGLANHLAAARVAVPSFVFGWERHIPFLDWTIFPYWSLNAFYGLSLLLARSRHELDRHGARLLTAQCIAVACFVAFPLHFSFGQPETTGAAGWLFAALRGFDQPFNQAPSLHIALVVVLWDLYRRFVTAAWARLVLHGWALAIGVSVLTTYQHHFIDVPTGALLGVLCVWAWPLERRVSPLRAWRLSRDRHRRRLGACYALGAAACAALGFGFGSAALWLLWPAVSLALVAANYIGLGARGFQVDAAGRMAWPARVLLAPYLRAARLNSWLWTRRRPAAQEVLPGLWLGRLQAAPPQARLVSLCAELPVPTARTVWRAQGAQKTQTAPTAQTARTTRMTLTKRTAPACICLPWLDLVPASPAALRRAASAIERARQAGGPVAVACALGLSRSVAALACWLVRSGQTPDLESALTLLRRAQPRLVLGPAWLAALRLAVQR